MVANEEKRFRVRGCEMEFMCKGNVDAGLTTIEEKSLGATHKSGSSPIKGVLEFSQCQLLGVKSQIEKERK